MGVGSDLSPVSRLAVPLAMGSVLACNHLPGRLGRALRGLLAGLWLGLLDNAVLKLIDERYYERDATYHSEDWNARGLHPCEREAFNRAFRPGQRVAVVACGGGREVLALLESGCEAIGYEPHPMLRGFGERFLARRGYPGRVHEAGRDSWPETGTCDGGVVGWTALSLIAPRSSRQNFLSDAAATIDPAGRLVVSCFERTVVGRELVLIHRVASGLRALRGAEPVELGDAMAPNRVHVFSREELVEDLGAAGWRVEATWSQATEERSVSYMWAVASRV